MTHPLTETTFAAIVKAALAGNRCPMNGREGFPGLEVNAVRALAHAGRIRIEVYPHNWRVVEILDGPHTGKRTAPPPDPMWRPYLIIDKDGSRKLSAPSARRMTRTEHGALGGHRVTKITLPRIRALEKS